MNPIFIPWGKKAFQKKFSGYPASFDLYGFNTTVTSVFLVAAASAVYVHNISRNLVVFWCMVDCV